MAKLAGKLPKGDGDGLSAIDIDLVQHPDRVRVALALLDVSKINVDIDDGTREPTARIRQIEIITEDIPTLKRLIERAYEQRTGSSVLPFDLEAELAETLANVNPATGEIKEGDE